MNMSFNPSLYQINTRVWIHQFDTIYKAATLADVPLEYWQNLASDGIDFVWLMGVWKPCQTTAKYGATADNLNYYSTILPDFDPNDVVPSPFAIDDYIINPTLGTLADLLDLKRVLNQLNIKLILDFIGNHFSRDSKLLEIEPQLFLQGSIQDLHQDPGSFFQKDNLVFAHGKDPHFEAWVDTVQVNYFEPVARRFMADTLLKLTEICDGVRCDMTMLMLTDVFGSTWKTLLERQNIARPESDFWQETIHDLKIKNPDFVLIAEVYWNLEYQMQLAGFDYTYDKKLYDYLAANQTESIQQYLHAELNYQQKMARFIENHDEDRSIQVFDKPRVLAAAVAISTLPGLRFYQDGQWWGSRIHLPMQLKRTKTENHDTEIDKFYEKLLEIVESPAIKHGNWQLNQVLPENENNFSFKNIIAWQWQQENEIYLIFINYSDQVAQAFCKLDFNTQKNNLLLKDLLTDVEYPRDRNDMAQNGLYIKLTPFQSHIFKLEL